jgi:site-specific DNA-methyltransferase (adenine-specific)
MKDLSANSVDLIICDLPYGCLSNNGNPKISEKKKEQYGKGRIPSEPNGCMWDIKIDLEAFWKEVRRIRKDEHTPTIHFCTTKFGYELIQSNPNEFRYDLVWDKQRGVSFLSANKMPMRSHEMIYVFSKAGAFYKRVDISGNPYHKTGITESKVYNLKPQLKDPTKITNTRCSLSVISNQNAAHKKDQHPTEKPIDLYKWLIERYCPPEGTVLDPTFGSGNSVFTAYALGRNAIGIEKDEKFFKKAEARLEQI